MPPIHLKGSLLLDLNPLHPSERVPTIGPQCPQSSKRFQFDLLLTWRHWPPIMRGLLLTWRHWPPIMRDLSDGLRALRFKISPNISKSVISSKLGCLKNQENIFSKNKRPQLHPGFTWEFTLRELLHFYRDLKNGVDPIFAIFVTFYHIT